MHTHTIIHWYLSTLKLIPWTHSSLQLCPHLSASFTWIFLKRKSPLPDFTFHYFLSYTSKTVIVFILINDLMLSKSVVSMVTLSDFIWLLGHHLSVFLFLSHWYLLIFWNLNHWNSRAFIKALCFHFLLTLTI